MPQPVPLKFHAVAELPGIDREGGPGKEIPGRPVNLVKHHRIKNISLRVWCRVHQLIRPFFPPYLTYQISIRLNRPDIFSPVTPENQANLVCHIQPETVNPFPVVPVRGKPALGYGENMLFGPGVDISLIRVTILPVGGDIYFPDLRQAFNAHPAAVFEFILRCCRIIERDNIVPVLVCRGSLFFKNILPGPAHDPGMVP